MSEPTFVWTPELTKRFFQLRFKYDRLFKNRKQAWIQFREILCRKHDFPQEMTVEHVRKKWSYSYDCYRLAKKSKNKKWKFYKMFEKHYGKAKILDKFESWNDEWRCKLIIAVVEATALKLDPINMWRTVERSLRSQDLPMECCIQDIKNLWHYIKVTFTRKYRVYLRKKLRDEWPHYDAMLSYYETYENDVLTLIATDRWTSRLKATPGQRGPDEDVETEEEFQWTKNITESFIQVKLQNDALMREKKWFWGPLRDKMVKEYGFPKCLTTRDISKKWNSIYKEYQKAVASQNTSWIYYKLFECYLGGGTFSLNPMLGWHDEYIFILIRARAELELYFANDGSKSTFNPWCEVEKRLRNAGLPLDNSLLDLPEIWTYLLNMFTWKKKFADKGMLAEDWPFYDAMKQYIDSRPKKINIFKKYREEHAMYDDDNGDGAIDDDFDDDIKLFDLKQKMKPKVEIEVNSCRSCSAEEGCVNVFEGTDDAGLCVAHKLRVICGVQVEKTDNLPKLLCLNCLRDLESAYIFREKCRQTDTQLRTQPTDHHYEPKPSSKEGNNNTRIKVEIDEFNESKDPKNEGIDNHLDYTDFDIHDGLSDADEYLPPRKPPKKRQVRQQIKPVQRPIQRPKKKKKGVYVYTQICEVCGKHTKNLLAHMDMHSTEKAYECEVCQKRFKFKSGLLVHKAVHDPQPKKTCEVCGKTFHIVAQYKRHFVYHANERKFSCETCGKRFNTLDILKVHTRMHTDERPFSCQDCGKTFRTTGCVSRHRRIVHKKSPKQNMMDLNPINMNPEGVIPDPDSMQ